MSTKKISELTAKTSLSGTEEFIINDGGTSKKVAASNFGFLDSDLTTALIDSNYVQARQSAGGGGGEFALLDSAGDGNLYSSNLTNFGTTRTTGTKNFIAGVSAGDSLTTGYNNVAIGENALQNTTTANENIAIGTNAGYNITSGYGNISIGRYANRSNGGYNVGIGTSALTNCTGEYNVAIGDAAAGSGSTNSCDRSVYVGWGAGYLAAGSSYSVMVGTRAGYKTTSATNNTYLGYYAGYNSTSGENVCVGANAMRNNTTATYNTAVGANAGFYSTGGSNTFLGCFAGDSVTTGSNITCVGYDAEPSAVDTTNEITLGNSSVATLRCQVTSITSLSDERDKTNIEDLSAGLNFVNELRPVKFTWNMRDGGKVDQPDTGFIAQDLQQVQETTGVDIPGLVYDENPEKLEAAYGKLIPVLVKSIQDLSAQVEALKTEIETLK